ncbi:MAG: branched-chain amino acid ABC transporter permease [Acidimicrobiaceae bacterium]|nr:branched-chain amino acid ABC transporter permease [Acidimicrobiaceae bacterium]
MKSILTHQLFRRFITAAAVLAVVAVMTGPAGSTEAPTAGFTGSFSERSSFFGFFETVRWVPFLFLALVFFGVWTLWLSRGAQIKSGVSQVMQVPRAATQRRPVRWGIGVVLLFVALILPHVINDPFWQAAMVEQIAVYVLLAIGLNVVVGFAGLLDLGFVAFYAIGAYVTAWVTGALPTPPLFGIHMDPFFAIPIAIVIVMVAGIVLGVPTLRLRGDYLAIVTLGFGEIITIFANNLYGITGGSQGTSLIPHFSLHIGPIKYVWGLAPVPYYYLTLVFVVIFLLAFSLLEHSRVGRAWTAIREDEVAAESVGINPLKYKVMAFAIGASTAGFAGVVTASQSNNIFPSSFSLAFSINILVLVIFGGMGSIFGVVLGALLIQTGSMYLLHSPPAGYQSSDLYIYLGALLVVMMIFRPAGLVPSRRRRREIVLSEAGEGHMNEVLTGDQP